MSEDPIGFASGDTNLYRYVFNSPDNATDPSGNIGLFGAAVGALFGAGAYLFQYATGGVEDFSWADLGAYTAGGAVAGAVGGVTLGASLKAAGGLGLGTVGTSALAGGATGVAAGASGGFVAGAGSMIDDAVRGDATWGDVGAAGLSGAGRGALYGGIGGALGGAAFPIVASLTSGGVAGGFIAGSTSAVAGDLAAQTAGVALGLQNSYDTGQTAFAGIGGGILGGAMARRHRNAMRPGDEGVESQHARDDPAGRVRSKVDEMAANMTNWELRNTTFAAAEVRTVTGAREMWVAGAGRTGYVPPRIRGYARNVRSPAKPQHQKLPHINDAERHIHRTARREGARIEAIGATRIVCTHCQKVLPRSRIVTERS